MDRRQKATLISGIVMTALTVAPMAGCGKKSSSDKKKTTTTTNTKTAAAGKVTVGGQLALNLMLSTARPTHVVGINTETDAKAVAVIAADGTFSLPIDKESPWVLTYVNSAAVGIEMLVSRFGSGSLDTVAPAAAATAIALGTVDASAATATTSTTADALLADMGLSAAAAETLGAVDDIGLRYINPDIDGNGLIDAIEKKTLILDFHNRFTARRPASDGGGQYAMADMKNAFLPDNIEWNYTGTGVKPELEKSWFATPPTSYSWTFSGDTVLNASCVSGPSSGATLAAGTECQQAFDANDDYNKNYGRYQLGMEVKPPVDGTYILKVQEKTYTWTNVKVANFSAGSGFIALFLKFNVSDAGKLTGFDWKWQKKGTGGVYELTTQEELKLLVKSVGGYLSLKVDGANSGKSLGTSIPLTPTGTYDLLTAKSGSGGIEAQGITLSEVNAGLLWSRCTENPGISYDDKLGMRFFF